MFKKEEVALALPQIALDFSLKLERPTCLLCLSRCISFLLLRMHYFEVMVLYLTTTYS